MRRPGSRHPWLRFGLALWLVAVTFAQGIPTALASVPALDGPVPALDVSQGQDGPRSLYEEPDPLPPWPTVESVTMAPCPPPSGMEPTPVRVLVPPGSVDRMDRPPTP